MLCKTKINSRTHRSIMTIHRSFENRAFGRGQQPVWRCFASSFLLLLLHLTGSIIKGAFMKNHLHGDLMQLSAATSVSTCFVVHVLQILFRINSIGLSNSQHAI